MKFEEQFEMNIMAQEMAELQQEMFEESVKLMAMGYGEMEIVEKEG